MNVRSLAPALVAATALVLGPGSAAVASDTTSFCYTVGILQVGRPSGPLDYSWWLRYYTAEDCVKVHAPRTYDFGPSPLVTTPQVCVSTLPCVEARTVRVTHTQVDPRTESNLAELQDLVASPTRGQVGQPDLSQDEYWTCVYANYAVNPSPVMAPAMDGPGATQACVAGPDVVMGSTPVSVVQTGSTRLASVGTTCVGAQCVPGTFVDAPVYEIRQNETAIPLIVRVAGVPVV